MTATGHRSILISSSPTSTPRWRAEAVGARVESPPATYRWGKLALLAGPFGRGLCLIEFLGRGYDEIATGVS